MATETRLFPFNVRVYGLLLDRDQVLCAQELIKGMAITKFPGGGLQFGEGTRACLVREFEEELGLAVTTGEHLYTTDFFQPSAFNPEHQVVSIYYRVHPVKPLHGIYLQPEIVSQEPGVEQRFQWMPLDTLDDTSFTFPIDQHVARLILTQFRG